MRNKLFPFALLIVVSALMVPSRLLAAEIPGTAGEDDKKYAGLWTGSYSTDNGNSDKLTYILSQDEKGQWRGTVKFVNQDGEQTAEFKSLQIVDGKMKGKIEGPDGQVEVTIEGQFQGDKSEGTFSVSAKGSTDVMDKGTWKVTKSSTAKTGQ
ncbi:MAG TPA: hypothetical protein VKD91_14875 [Pyrinomonadaceae bacterium]|nr:hypothetical protein [Pyrinomonadaceae bacterium]